MKIIIEEVEGAHYQDVILDPEEIGKLSQGKLTEGMAIIRGRRYYIGIRLGYQWRHEDEASSAFLEEKQAE